MESYMEIWTRHYDSLDDRGRINFLLTLKVMKYEGNVQASNAFTVLWERFCVEKPVWKEETVGI